MAEKKALVVLASSLSLSGSSDALDKLKKKAAVLPNADANDLTAKVTALGATAVAADALASTLENGAACCLLEGGEEALSAALEAADRRTLIVVSAADGVAFYGLAINSKAGSVERAVTAEDIAVTIATIADLAITADCTGAIIYQVLKNPNLKLDEVNKLKEALARMESVIQRDNREPWDKHDCA